MTDHRFFTKKQRREQALKERNALNFQYMRQANSVINGALADLSPLQNAGNIMAYAAFGSEVDLDETISNWLRQNKRVWLPRISSAKQLEAVEFTAWEQCFASSLGIREPVGVSAETDEIEAVIVPGVLFDRQGYRIGYGKGYYDKFLTLLSSNVFLCGVCFDFQLIENIEPEIFDVPLHCVVTDRQIVYAKKNLS